MMCGDPSAVHVSSVVRVVIGCIVGPDVGSGHSFTRPPSSATFAGPFAQPAEDNRSTPAKTGGMRMRWSMAFSLAFEAITDRPLTSDGRLSLRRGDRVVVERDERLRVRSAQHR